MKISVIMPSYLGEYEGCASNREEKLLRAINSFLNNSYPDKELIIVCDGCLHTWSIVKHNFHEAITLGEIKLIQHKKQKTFSGNLRTKGIEVSTGDYIIYLDSDDMFGNNHIKSIAEQVKMNDYDWGYFNDFIYGDSGLVTKNVELEKGSIGTSSIFHRKYKGVDWRGCDGYGHDYDFIKKLMSWSRNYSKIYGASYIICHIPNVLDK